MATFKIDDRDFKRASAALQKEQFSALAGQTVGFALQKSGNAVRRNVRAAAKPHRRTGKMANQIRVDRKGVGLATVVKVRAGGSVAHLVARGTKAHDITPRNAKALTIRGRSSGNSANAGVGSKTVRAAGGVVAIRRFAHHPGYRPSSNFWDDGVKAAEPEVQAFVKQGAETMVRNLAFKMRGR